MKLFRSFIALCVTLLMVCSMCFSAFAYNDVPSDNENLQAIEFVDRLGIIPSTWNGDFKPDQYLTRADAIVAVYKMLYKDEIDETLYMDTTVDFVGNGETGDISDTSVLKAYLCWAVDNYLVSTNVENSKFLPSEPITANELLTLLAKVLCLVEDGAEYPDACVEAISGVETGLEAGDTPVTREQAAVAFTAAIVSSEGSSGELGVYTDEDGNPLDSLAAKVFHMSSIDLVIRATTNKKLGYDVQNGTLLSNGADVDFGTDLSDYVGYGIKVTYSDNDNSLTFTEDEEVLTYSISSTLSVTAPLTKVVITGGNAATIESDSGNLNFATSTYMYLNDAPWPVEDEKYDLSKLVGSISGTVTKVLNRPNLVFKCMQAEGDEVLTTVFATESRPGKILGINNGIYTVYDYYYAGTDKELRNYNVSDCKFSGTVKVGDFVSFYETNGICYFNPGNAVTTTLKSKVESELVDVGAPVQGTNVTTTMGKSNEYTFADDSTHLEHAFLKMGDCILVANEELKGPVYTFITDGTEQSFIITWEAFQTNYATLKIDEIKPDTQKAESFIKATNIKTNEQVEFTVKFDNINSTTALAAGDIITYSDDLVEASEETKTESTDTTGTADAASTTEDTKTEDKKTVPDNIYVKKSESKLIDVMYDEANKAFVDINTQKVYYLNQFFMGNLGTGTDLKDGDIANAKLALDMANTVVYYIA